jgi:hypothetical protein
MHHIYKRYFCFIICSYLLIISNLLLAQRNEGENLVFVDKRGVMRWSRNKTEVQGFGINYTVPFAHAFRSAKKLGVSHKQAIDNDVYHFARLGFDAYRVHVWDTEISDTVGNLLNNEHLQLFDYMLKKMKDRGMKFILTPIAFWGNGWPEPDEKTPGFSYKYGKDNCLVDEEAIKAQEKYLFQFLSHVNPHTGIAYKDDPDIIAFEISNEPHHRGSATSVTTYIDRMVASMRRTKCKKPIFYNISHSIHFVNAYFDAGIQGGTFQWYPTGLGAQEELGGNLLPNVDRYTVAFADNPKFKKGAKIVYEFDAADVGRSYIYPAMARSFRQAGIQWAAHFSYDPTFMAYANTEYNTHFMNLAYAPQKALSLKIAGEVFHNIPLYKDFGAYPGNTNFGPFSVSYERDLAEMITDKKFIYTNHTRSVPRATESLEEIAGFGNSPLIAYEGEGAYFLDKIEDGVWRLEVMPDALWLKDPFGRNSLDRQLAAVNWREWPMSITLPDLGSDFSVRAVDESNSYSTTVAGQTFSIYPGTYLVTRKGVSPEISAAQKFKNILLKEFTAPKSDLKNTDIIHMPTPEISAAADHTIEALVASVEAPDAVELNILSGFRPKVLPMKKVSGYNYAAVIPAGELTEGFLRYFITIREKDIVTTFPSSKPGSPSDWDFRGEPFETRVVPASSPIFIFNALSDNDKLSRQWNRASAFVPLGPGAAEVRVNIEKLSEVDPENPKAETVHDYSMRYYFGDKIAGRKGSLREKKKIVFRGRSLTTKRSTVQLALVTKTGFAFGGFVTLEQASKDYSIALSDLKQVKLVTLPRPYPTFLPYFFQHVGGGELNLDDVETLQISIGPGIPEGELENMHAIGIESVRLE